MTHICVLNFVTSWPTFHVRTHLLLTKWKKRRPLFMTLPNKNIYLPNSVSVNHWNQLWGHQTVVEVAGKSSLTCSGATWNQTFFWSHSICSETPEALECVIEWVFSIRPKPLSGRCRQSVCALSRLHFKVLLEPGSLFISVDLEVRVINRELALRVHFEIDQ